MINQYGTPQQREQCNQIFQKHVEEEQQQRAQEQRQAQRARFFVRRRCIWAGRQTYGKDAL
jgi:hypothetical protein